MTAFTGRDHVASDGLGLFWRDYAPIGDGDRLPLVCLHGLTRNSADFEALAPSLASLGHRVLVPDMRGRGKSAHDPNPGNYAVPRYVGDVVEILMAQGIGRAGFIGTSMGGLMIMGLAAFAPQMIAGAVLNDVGPVLGAQGLSRIRAYVGKDRSYDSLESAEWAVRGTFGPAYPTASDAFWVTLTQRLMAHDPVRGWVFAYDPRIADAFNASGTAPTVDLWPLFDALPETGLLMVRGALSELLEPETFAQMQARKPGALALTVPLTGHAPTLDEVESREAMAAWLARLT